MNQADREKNGKEKKHTADPGGPGIPLSPLIWKKYKKLVSLFVTLGTVQELLSFDRRVSYYNCS